MGGDGKVEIDLFRARTAAEEKQELLVTHSGLDADGKYRSVVLALDHDFARIYEAFVTDAVRALRAERAQPSAEPKFISPPDPKGGRK